MKPVRVYRREYRGAGRPEVIYELGRVASLAAAARRVLYLGNWQANDVYADLDDGKVYRFEIRRGRRGNITGEFFEVR